MEKLIDNNNVFRHASILYYIGWSICQILKKAGLKRSAMIKLATFNTDTITRLHLSLLTIAI